MQQNPFGTTRTTLRPDHALLCPDSHVEAPLPGGVGQARAVVLISPRLGTAQFTQYLASLGPSSALPPLAPRRERFVFVLEGAVSVAGTERLEPGGFAYLPPDGTERTVATEPDSATTTRLLVFERPYCLASASSSPPHPVFGREQDVAGAPFLGDPGARLQVLLPDIPAFDMAINIFTYDPGATLPFVEAHVMEHGLLMLSGSGVYRLGNDWYPVQAGDVIWMAPFCPQWFVAMGKEPARYLYYKDVNRDPLADGSERL